MARTTSVLKQARNVIRDSDLLKALRSEIAHEQSNASRFQDSLSGSFGEFAIDWDSALTQDIVLRKKCEFGEEVAVSALLGPESHESESNLFREVLMKVCIRKPGLRSILQFDCRVSDKGDMGPDFEICNAYYLPSTTCLGPSTYKGPIFSSLDPSLQGELKKYLVSKGIEKEFTGYLLHHMHRKEHGQYVNWLLKLREMVAQDK